MTTLVTGAAGATGRALLRVLEENRVSVRSADRVDTGREGHTTCDLVSPEATLALVRDVRPSVAYHLVGTFTNVFETDHAANVLAARALLEAIRVEAPKCRVLVVGSAAEYGLVPEAECPIAETRPSRPASVYGLTKSMQSTLTGYYHAAFGLDVVVARTFNLKGRGLPKELLPGRLDREIERKIKGEIDVIALGPLDAKRDYLPLDEAARAYVRIVEKGAAGEVYNVGSGLPVTMRDYVAERLAEDGLGLDVVREGAPAGNTAAALASWANVAKLRALG